MYKISPSILSADFANLGRDILRAVEGGVDYIHIDVMDGHFVPNISVGLPVVSSVRKITDIPLDVHLMIEYPDKYAARFIEAGADILTFHIEAQNDLGIAETLRLIRSLGARPGLTIKPGTPVEALREYLHLCDMVLIMTVEPGFGGQKFIPETMEKITATRKLIEELNPSCELEIDGGVGAQNLTETVAAGANVIVMGSAVFKEGQDPVELLSKLKF